MRLRFLTLALVTCVSSSFNPVLSMDDAYDAVEEYELRKERGKLHYLRKIKGKPEAVRAEEDDSDSTSVSSAPSEEDTPVTGVPITLKFTKIDLPELRSKKGKFITRPQDALQVTITLADGKPYQFGSEESEISIPSFAPKRNRGVGRFGVHIRDRTRHFIPGAPALLCKDNDCQTLSRCIFTPSSAVTSPTVSIEYDEGSRKFFASGLWPKRLDE